MHEEKMLLEILDKFACPICQDKTKLWKLEGDITETRIVDGHIICPNSHIWYVREEILRFDKQNSDEDMQLLDYDKTGFPSTDKVGELERGDFFMKFEEYVHSLSMDSDKLLKVAGSSILFFKYLKENERKIVVIHPNEGILRQIQVIAAKKLIYKNITFIRGDDARPVVDTENLYILFDDVNIPDIDKTSKVLVFNDEVDGNVIWHGENTKFIEITATD